jgi:hypothetical protein
VRVHADVASDERFRHADKRNEYVLTNAGHFHHGAWRMPVEPVIIEACAYEVRWG